MAGKGSYGLMIQVVPSNSALTSGNVYFAMTNTDSTKIVNILNMYLTGGFIGSGNINYSQFGVCRFSGATPTGGTSIPVTKYDNNHPSSAIGDARYTPNGLLIAGITFENDFFGGIIRSNVYIQPVFQLNLNTYENSFVLRPGEGLAIRSLNTIISGFQLFGGINWYEL